MSETFFSDLQDGELFSFAPEIEKAKSSGQEAPVYLKLATYEYLGNRGQGKHARVDMGDGNDAVPLVSAGMLSVGEYDKIAKYWVVK